MLTFDSKWVNPKMMENYLKWHLKGNASGINAKIPNSKIYSNYWDCLTRTSQLKVLTILERELFMLPKEKSMKNTDVWKGKRREEKTEH